MPTFSNTNPWDDNPHRWFRCREAAGKQMLAQGWPPKSGKFSEVQRKRALRLWREGKIQ